MRVITNYQSSGKNEKKPKDTGKSSKRNSKNASGFSTFWSFISSPQMIKLYGILLMLFAILAFISILSYYFTWAGDREFVNNGGEEIVENWCGKLGAYLSVWLTEYIFGIFSITLPFLFFLLGIRMTFNRTPLPLLKTTATIILSTAWLSMTLALFLIPKAEFVENSKLFFAGGFGEFTTRLLVDSTGRLATFFILLAILLIILILCYNISTDAIAALFSKIRFRKREKSSSETDKNRSKKTNPEKESDLQDLSDLYISQRNELADEYDNNKIVFEPEQNIEEEDTEEADTPLTVLNRPVQEEKESDVEFEITQGDGNHATTENEFGEEEENLEEEVHPDPFENLAEMEDYDPRKDLSQYQFPTTDLLLDYESAVIDEHTKMRDLREKKERIEKTLKSFNIPIKKIYATVGPTVTLYEIVPEDGVRISKIKNLEDDIALNLAALGIRIIAPIPGKGTIGIEVPNSTPQIVPMKDILSSEKFINSKYDLPIGLGKTISNEPFVADLAKMPHLLMAGATGQGKSVGLNAIIASLLYKKHPSELKFVLIDPKKVEFTLYSIIENHYLAMLPGSEDAIITDVKKVIYTLNSLCAEMDARYDLLKVAKVRNIKEYNAKFCKRQLSPANGHRYLPYIVLIIDEFGDLIMTAGREVETPIARLAQLARAIGIHLVIATQRPSVNIITGIIKANFPSRMAFRVSSKVDSRTILDCGGADQLIGKGDMLLSTGSDLIRMQCAFIDTPEVETLTKFIADQQGYPEPFLLPEYVADEEAGENDEPIDSDSIDSCFMDAAVLIVETQQGSTSMLQRKMKLGYNRAGRIMDQLEEFKIVGPAQGSKVREVKVKTQEELRVIFQSMGLI